MTIIAVYSTKASFKNSKVLTGTLGFPTKFAAESSAVFFPPPPLLHVGPQGVSSRCAGTRPVGRWNKQVSAADPTEKQQQQ